MILPPPALKLPSHLLEHATILSERKGILPLLPKAAVFVEVGVATGDFSQMVLTLCAPKEFVAIDEFRLHELSTIWGQPSKLLFEGRTHADTYRSRFAPEISRGQMRVLTGDSATCLRQLEDESVDVIYIDADHRYEGIKRDLNAAVSKVRQDGWIIVNDYVMVDQLGATESYGVVNATNEFMIEHDWAMQYFALETRMFCDVALRPRWVLGSAIASSAALSAEIERLNKEVAVLRNSTSWKLTAPLRAIARGRAKAVAGRS